MTSGFIPYYAPQPAEDTPRNGRTVHVGYFIGFTTPALSRSLVQRCERRDPRRVCRDGDAVLSLGAFSLPAHE